MAEREQAKKPARPAERVPTATATSAKKKLSYLEAREWAGIEDRIGEAEARLAAARMMVEDPAVATDAARLVEALAEQEKAQEAVDSLFARWAELEAKQA
jgi:ATP-binding cassette subfamily F protein uup